MIYGTRTLSSLNIQSASDESTVDIKKKTKMLIDFVKGRTRLILETEE